MASVGQRLRTFAKNKYKTVRALAEALGKKEQALQLFLSDKRKPSGELLEQLRNLGCDIDWLLSGETTKSGWDLVENKPRIVASPVQDYVVSVPMFLTPVKAGRDGFIPEHADAYMQPAKYFNSNTKMIEVEGDSMEDIGIRDGSFIVMDEVMEARNGSIVVARIGTGWVVKRLEIIEGSYFLLSMNGSKKYERIKFNKDSDIDILGVVLMVSTLMK